MAIDMPVERNGYGKPVVALDIDGTCGDYHSHFINFIRGYYDRPFPSSQKYNPGLAFHEFLGLDLRDYRAAKLAYRQGGWKRTMPAYEQAAAVSRVLRLDGAEVWICTTRPYNRLDNIDPDTREFLRRNNFTYDYILYGEEKYNELVRQVGPERIVAAVDDLPEMVDAALAAGIEQVYLRDQPYNKHLHTANMVGVERFSSFQALLGKLSHDVNEWRCQHDG